MLEDDARGMVNAFQLYLLLELGDKELAAFRELANRFASPRRNLQVSREAYGRGAGVGRGRGVGACLGVGVGLAVAVGVADAVAVGVAVAVAVGVGEGDAQGLTGQLKISIESKRVTPSDP